jgi:hypothetical protein
MARKQHRNSTYDALANTALEGSTGPSPSITITRLGETSLADKVVLTSRNGPIAVPFAIPIWLVLKLATGVFCPLT